jgi:hypothetical protein
VWDLLRQLDPITWIVGLVLAIPLSIIANLLTNPVRNWMGRWSAKRAERRGRELEKNLRSIEALTKSYVDLGLRLAGLGVGVLMFFAIGNALVVLVNLYIIPAHTSQLLLLLAAFVYAVSIVLAVATLSMIERVRDFGAYRERTERQIAELKARASRAP